MIDENGLIEKIRTNGAEELELVYVEHRNEFIAWLLKSFNLEQEDAKDIYQQTILIFYENIINGKLTNFTSKIKTYLFAIGRNKAMEHSRSSLKTIVVEVEKPVEIDTNLEVNETENHLGIMKEALVNLGEPCSSLLQLFYYDKYSLVQLTEKFGYKNTDTAKNQKYKCLQRLRKIFNSGMQKAI